MIFIWAEDKKHGIGLDGHLPWHLPADLAFFKAQTTGYTLLSGARTFASYGGRALPNRKNLVLTRHHDATDFPAGVVILRSIEEVLDYENDHQDETLFISGGAKVFASLMPYVQTLVRTQVDGDFEVDTLMPDVDYDQFQLVSQESRPADEKNPLKMTFERFERR